MLQTVAKTTDHASQERRVTRIQLLYRNTVALVERLHQRLLDVICGRRDAHARVLSGIERFL